MATLNRNIPYGMKFLLDYIGNIEAPKGYGTVYNNKQGKLEKPLTQWTVNEIIGANPSFYRRHGSSAAGRYQIMQKTLMGLRNKFPEIGTMRYTPELQDALGAELLRQRGWQDFVTGKSSLDAFALALAQEWASLPVLRDMQGANRRVRAGESYYAGDTLNKSLTTPAEFRRALVKAMSPGPGAAPMPIASVPLADVEPEAVPAPPLVPVTASGSAKGFLSGVWALIQGKPPVKAAERSDVRAEVKAEAPSLAKELGGLRLASLATLFGGVVGGAQDTGILDSVKGAADQASSTAQSVQQLVNLIFGLIRWSVNHWWVFFLAIGAYMLVKVGWAVYKIWVQIQQNRAISEYLRSK